MRFLTCSIAIAGLSLINPTVPRGQAQDSVDAATFALAFRDGKADQYKGRTIAGVGVQFGVSAPGALLTLGAAGDDKRLAPVTTNEEFRAAQTAHTTVQVIVSASEYSPSDRSHHASEAVVYAFTGVYTAG